ncbi:MAG TPA: hypothetical protein VI702_06870, partial [Nitrospiria bacterium]
MTRVKSIAWNGVMASVLSMGLVLSGFFAGPSHALTLVKNGKIDPEELKALTAIMQQRHGDAYAEQFQKAFAKTRDPGRELFRVMPNCFINQQLMHFSGTPLSVTFRPTEVNTCFFCHQ